MTFTYIYYPGRELKFSLLLERFRMRTCDFRRRLGLTYSIVNAIRSFRWHERGKDLSGNAVIVAGCLLLRCRRMAWSCFIRCLLLCQTLIRSAWIKHHLTFLRSMPAFTSPCTSPTGRDSPNSLCISQHTQHHDLSSLLFCFAQPHAPFTIAVRNLHAYEGKTIP